MCGATTLENPCELELMTTLGCHLCDKAVAVLLQVLDAEQFTLDLVDIAYDDHLMAQYAERIPVLVCPAQNRELAWPFDASQLTVFAKELLAARFVPC